MSKIFIVDDDPIHQRIVQIMIEKHNIYDEYVSFLQAQAALNQLNENIQTNEALPDVILLDLNMPEMDGWAFLEEFQGMGEPLTSDIRIYIVSSSVDEKDILRSREYSCVKGFISKPLSPAILRDTL